LSYRGRPPAKEKTAQEVASSLTFTIFEENFEDTCTRCEKYSSKLDISRSFIRIFAKNVTHYEIPYRNTGF